VVSRIVHFVKLVVPLKNRWSIEFVNNQKCSNFGKQSWYKNGEQSSSYTGNIRAIKSIITTQQEALEELNIPKTHK